MKKLTIISNFILVAAIMLSCSKETLTRNNEVPPPPPPPPPPPVKIASSWFSPVFTIVNDRSSIYLMAQKDHETRVTYDGGTHLGLAYVKLNDQRAVTVKRLPSIFLCPANPAISNKHCEINFGINNAGCAVTIKNADRNMSPSIILANPFPDMQVRYIVISRALFNSLNINWDDYAAVAAALNI